MAKQQKNRQLKADGFLLAVGGSVLQSNARSHWVQVKCRGFAQVMVNDIYLEERQKALRESTELLWENITDSIWWNQFEKFDGNELALETARVQHEHYHPVFVSFKTSILGSVQELPEGKARMVLQYGAGRRLLSIYSAIVRFAEIAYPDRTEVCTEDEQRELDDSLLILYISIPAFFDAISLALFYACRPSGFNERKVDIFDKRFLKAIELPELRSELVKFSEWHKRIVQELRHRYAHRVPPYVPSAELSLTDQEKMKELQSRYSDAILAKEWASLSKIMAEQQRLGSFCPRIYFFDQDAWMPLQTTVFDDITRFQVVALTAFEKALPLLISEKIIEN